MTGTLRVAGVGPGDPELMTVRAVRAIQQSDVICVPKGREEGSSLALSIAAKAAALEDKEIIEAYFPMKKTKSQGSGDRGQGPEGKDTELDEKWNETVQSLLLQLQRGRDVVFLTLGDPMIYSTFFYLYDGLKKALPDLRIEIIPGVSSINASAARAAVSLGLANEKIAILPANYMEDLKQTLEAFDTVVLMKVNKVWNEVVQLLAEMKMLQQAVFVSRATMEDEQIISDLNDVRQEEINYFSMVIVRK